MSTQKIKLVGAATYLYQGVRYEMGRVYTLDEASANEMLDKVDESDRPYFQIARDKDGPAAEPKLVSVVDAEKASAKKAAAGKKAKKTVTVSGGKIEGLDDGDDKDKPDDNDDGVEV